MNTLWGLPYNIVPVGNNTVLCTEKLVKRADLMLKVLTTIKKKKKQLSTRKG